MAQSQNLAENLGPLEPLQPGGMEIEMGRNKTRRPARDAPGMRVSGVDFNPGPDAQERLRRLFTILVNLADAEVPLPGKCPSRKHDSEQVA